SKSSLDINVQRGQSTSTRTMEMMETHEYLNIRREAFSNFGITPGLTPFSSGYAPELLAFDTTRYTDWKDYFIGGHANTTNINLSISGGGSSTRFLIGAGYLHETFVFPGDYANSRVSANINLSHRSDDKKLELELSANYSYVFSNSSGAPEVLKAFALPPNYPALLDEQGNINWEYNNIQLTGDAYANPMAYLKRRYSGKTNSLLTHFLASYEISPGLKVKSSFGLNNLVGNEITKNPRASYDPTSSITSSANFGRNEYSTWIIEPQVDYNCTVGEGRIHALLGGTIQKNINTQLQMTGENYPDDNLLASISSAGVKSVFDSYSDYKYAAIFGRINYVLKNQFLVNINGRRDGSSRFGPGRKFGNFYSVGVGWIFTEAKVLNKNEVLSFGKIRASYGTTGNDNIGNYQYLSRWQASPNDYNGAAGYIPQNLPNDEFSWSTNKKLEVGLDLAFLSNRINLSASWFRNRSDNQLVSYILPSQTGFSSVTANFPALVQNSGVEIQAGGRIMQSKSLKWDGSLVLTIPRNKLVSFPGIENS